jgi:hypothetical protein
MDNLASHKVSGIGRYFAALHFGRYWHIPTVLMWLFFRQEWD